VGFVTGLSPLELRLAAREPDAGERARLEALLARRELREPLQHVLGVAHFYGLELAVDASVLVPRPETETLVRLALEALDALKGPGSLLDVGTGSGAIALAVKAERPLTTVLGSDVSAAALQVAAANAERLGLEVGFAQSDLLAGIAGFARAADVIVSNPPYLPAADRAKVAPEVLLDPALALYAGEDGLEVFNRLLGQLLRLARPDAVILLELDPRNVEQAAKLALEAGCAEAVISADLPGRLRFLRLAGRAGQPRQSGR